MVNGGDKGWSVGAIRDDKGWSTGAIRGGQWRQ